MTSRDFCFWLQGYFSVDEWPMERNQDAALCAPGVAIRVGVP